LGGLGLHERAGLVGGLGKWGGIVGAEESDGEETPRDGADSVIEGVGAGPAEVVAVDVGFGAEVERPSLDREGFEFFEPRPAEGGVVTAEVRENAAPDVTILLVHHRGAFRRG
jgi:hypothetical protein